MELQKLQVQKKYIARVLSINIIFYIHITIGIELLYFILFGLNVL